MQIPEMFSYVGIKDTKYEVHLILTQKYKMEERVKTEHNLATQAVWIFLYIYLFASFPFCIYFYFQYLSTFKISKNTFCTEVQ